MDINAYKQVLLDQQKEKNENSNENGIYMADNQAINIVSILNWL